MNTFFYFLVELQIFSKKLYEKGLFWLTCERSYVQHGLGWLAKSGRWVQKGWRKHMCYQLKGVYQISSKSLWKRYLPKTGAHATLWADGWLWRAGRAAYAHTIHESCADGYDMCHVPWPRALSGLKFKPNKAITSTNTCCNVSCQ